MENNNQNLSPLDALKSRMLNGKAKSEDKSESSAFGFTVETPDTAPEDEHALDFAIPHKSEEPEVIKTPPAEEKESRSLLKRMRPFTTDDDGHDVAEEENPEYTLDSVIDILKNEGAATDEELDVISNDIAEQNGESNPEGQEPEDSEEEPEKEKPDGFISDIDSSDDTEIFTPLDTVPPISADTATIRFTPIKGSKKLSVSSMTKPIDIVSTRENSSDSDSIREEFAETEFEKFVCPNEINSTAEAKKLYFTYSKKKRTHFFLTVGAFLATAVLLILTLIGNAGMLTLSILLGVLTLLNFDMFASVPKIFKKELSGDFLAMLCSLSTIALGILAYLQDENCSYVILLCGIILFVRGLMSYKSISVMQNNLKYICGGKPKNAITLISDGSTAVAMAKNSIEGDVLIAGTRQVNSVNDFVKYSTYTTLLSGKMPIVTVAVFTLAVIFGIISGIMTKNYTNALFTASVIMCIGATPSLFFMNALPNKSAARRLNNSGAMITGLAAAERLEQANAAVVSTADIFPAGTVTLQSMKVLSDNNVDDVLMRASSLTESMNSPLCPIFKKIAGTATEYKKPDSDTCKYEEHLGISGWVDNKLLFIGNRTLMEAHGISIPNVEIDHRILKQGFFPIYVANESKACVLLIVKYTVNPQVQKRLHQITTLGVTLLVDNCDPNITHDMIRDYFELYDDTIQVMTTAGIKMYKNATAPVKSFSTPAVYKGSTLNLTEIMTCASKMKASNLLLTVMYCITALAGIIYFLYTSFTGTYSMLPKSNTVFIFELIATAITLLLYLFKKP